MRRALAVAAVAVVAAGAAGGARAAEFEDTRGRFLNVFSAGQGRNLNGPEAAAAFFLGAPPPPSFTSQLPMYTGIIAAAPRLGDADLARYFKPAGFLRPEETVGRVDRPRRGVQIVRDPVHEVPRVYGESRADTMFGAGYVAAQDRLFQMDLLRHLGAGRLGELVGPTIGLPNDIAYARGGNGAVYTDEELRARFDRLPAELGPDGARVQADLRAYAGGINAYIGDVRTNPTKLPGEYAAIGRLPRDWTVVDSLRAHLQVLVSGDQGGSGFEVANALLLSQLEAAVGPRAGRSVFEDLRRADDPEAPVSAPRRFRSQRLGPVDPAAVARPDRGSVKPLDVGGSGAQSGPKPVAPRSPLLRGVSRAIALLRRSEHSYGFIVGARASASGHPLGVLGPQSGHGAPHVVFHEVELHGPGIHARGGALQGTAPYVYQGHGADSAWVLTDGLADVADMFAERLCEPDGSPPTRASLHYIYRGRCVPFRVGEVAYTTTPNGADQSPPMQVRLRSLRSVHGQVDSTGTVGGRPVAFAKSIASIGHEFGVWGTVVRLNAGVRGARAFIAAAASDPQSDHVLYVDDRDIAYSYPALVPRRARGVDVDLPTWGTGEWDWNGFLPRSRSPRAVSPRQGYLTNWNSRAALGWRAGDGTFFGSVHRVELVERPLRARLRRGRKISLAELAKLTQLAATQDLRGVEVWPVLRRAIRRAPTGDALLDQLIALLDAWRAEGAHRRDLDGDNVYEHSAAVALMDAWWDRLVHAILEPTIGKEALANLEARPTLHDFDGVLDGSAFGRGLWSYVDKDLRTILGERVRGRFSRRYCGGGVLTACRTIILSMLRAAYDEVAARQGPDPAAWKVPATCKPAQDPPSCDQVEFAQSGAASLPPMPFQNRSTIPQLVEITGHRPR